jgi:hypothetical protein
VATDFFVEPNQRVFGPDFAVVYRMKFLIFCLLLVAGSVSAQANFPRDYVGLWKGTLRVEAPGGASQETPMSLRIDSLKVRAVRGVRYGFVIQYQGQEPRKYELVVKDAPTGRYLIDEKDGIVLDAVLVNNRLISQFAVEGNLLTSMYHFQPDKITFELVFSGTKTTATGAKTGPPVTLYPVGGYHRAELSR